MHIHVLGVCGTFMSGVAILAKSMGYEVTGQDKAAFPPNLNCPIIAQM